MSRFNKLIRLAQAIPRNRPTDVYTDAANRSPATAASRTIFEVSRPPDSSSTALSNVAFGRHNPGRRHDGFQTPPATTTAGPSVGVHNNMPGLGPVPGSPRVQLLANDQTRTQSRTDGQAHHVTGPLTGSGLELSPGIQVRIVADNNRKPGLFTQQRAHARAVQDRHVRREVHFVPVGRNQARDADAKCYWCGIAGNRNQELANCIDEPRQIAGLCRTRFGPEDPPISVNQPGLQFRPTDVESQIVHADNYNNLEESWL